MNAFKFANDGLLIKSSVFHMHPERGTRRPQSPGACPERLHAIKMGVPLAMMMTDYGLMVP